MCWVEMVVLMVDCLWEHSVHCLSPFHRKSLIFLGEGKAMMRKNLLVFYFYVKGWDRALLHHLYGASSAIASVVLAVCGTQTLLLGKQAFYSWATSLVPCWSFNTHTFHGSLINESSFLWIITKHSFFSTRVITGLQYQHDKSTTQFPFSFLFDQDREMRSRVGRPALLQCLWAISLLPSPTDGDGIWI